MCSMSRKTCSSLACLLSVMASLSCHTCMPQNFAWSEKEVSAYHDSLRALVCYLSSMRWLKYQFERLGLQRRKQRSLTPVAVVRNCIQVYYVASCPRDMY